MVDGNLEIPEKRINKVIVLIRNIWCRMFGVSARTIANLAGVIISLSLCIGTITQLMTRHTYFVINNRSNWDSLLNLPECTGLHQELNFWLSNVKRPNGSRILYQLCRIYPVKIFPDSSSTTCAAFIENKYQMVCHQMLSVTERLQFSTYGELLGVKLAVESFGPVLKHEEVLFFSDSQNALKILEKGSRKENLHEVAMAVFSACVKFNIKMQLHWVPRAENEQADFLSRIIHEDTDDWQISDACFQYVNSLWEPATIDSFASFKNTILPRFNSRFRNPRTETVDCFTADWSHDMNLLKPPWNLVARCLRYLTECKAKWLLKCPEFYGDLIYKFKIIVGRADFF